VTEIETLADVVGRYAAQLQVHLPPPQPGDAWNNYQAVVNDVGRDRLAELAPAVVALSEAVRNLTAARALAPPAALGG
jgi:hypothetical protein